MPRGPRYAPGGMIFHVLNRGVGRRTLFHDDDDFRAFERILGEALARVPRAGTDKDAIRFRNGSRGPHRRAFENPCRCRG